MAKLQIKTERHPLAYRILHQLIMTAILFLIVTGFYIHHPFLADGWGFLMSLMRGVHFLAAGILILAVVLRILGMFFGPYRDWQSFIPSVADLKLLPRTINYYAHLGKQPEIEKKYNPLQMLSYLMVFLLAIFQIFSGFALLYPDGWLGWFNYGLFVSEINTRVAHYVATWVFILFLMIHLYLAIRENLKEMKQIHLLAKTDEK